MEHNEYNRTRRLRESLEKEIASLRRENEQLRVERDTYKPYYDALRARHNGYDPAVCRELQVGPPSSPEQALNELLNEADGYGCETAYGMIQRLKSERDALQKRVTNLVAMLQRLNDCLDDAFIEQHDSGAAAVFGYTHDPNKCSLCAVRALLAAEEEGK